MAALSGQDVTDRIIGQNAELLAEVNAASAAARNGWIFFLAVMAYFFVSLAGVTHKDLLLNTPVALPLLQVEIPLRSYFLFAPLILVLMHFGILLQHVMLSRKAKEFHDRMTNFEGSNLYRTHRLRMQLHSYFFVQAVAGPKRSLLLAAFLHGMSWITLGILPMVLLLDFQVTFLPYHDWVVTALHRSYLVLDFLILMVLGVFLRFPGMGFFEGLMTNLRKHPLNFVSTLIVSLSALIFSFVLATIPGSVLDQFAARLGAVAVSKNSALTAGKREAFTPTVWLFEGSVDETIGTVSSPFARNLVVMDQDLVPDTERKKEVSHALRGRDLRYAVLDRTDLHWADLADADLTGASLIEADLRGVRLRKARLRGTVMSGAYLTGADFTEADLQGATLSLAKLQGVNFQRADLLAANLVGAELQAAYLDNTRLYGGDLRGAVLLGANLVETRLEGADLTGATLQGADLTWAKLHGANLSGVRIWQTVPPDKSMVSQLIIKGAKIASLTQKDVESLKTIETLIVKERRDRKAHDHLRSLIGGFGDTSWESSEEYRAWSTLLASPQPDPATVSVLLAGKACRDKSQGVALADQLARRIAESRVGNPATFLKELQNCGMALYLKPEILAKLQNAATITATEVVTPSTPVAAPSQQRPNEVVTTDETVSKDETVTKDETVSTGTLQNSVQQTSTENSDVSTAAQPQTTKPLSPEKTTVGDDKPAVQGQP